MIRKSKGISWLAALLLIPSITLAQGALVDTQSRSDGGGVSVQLDATFGYSKLEEDSFFRIDAGLAVSIDQLAFAVHAPVHLRITDAEPTSENVIREEDWDEVSDYFRILRFLQYGKRDRPDPVFLRIGELVDVSLGHRSVVDRYYNVVDTNHYKMGIQAEVEVNYGGAEVFVDHLAPPNVAGFRGYIRPFTFFDTADIFKRFSSGLVFVGDFDAPVSKISTPSLGDTTALDGASTAPTLAHSTSTAAVYGWDIDWALVETDLIEWIPYFDFMALNTDGIGLHAGNFVNLYLSQDVSLSTQLEWRYASKGYQPSYFNSLYEIERTRFIGASGARGPKLTSVQEDPARKDRHGMLTGLDLTFSTYLTLGATYEDYEGPNNSNLTLRMVTPYITFVKFAAFYTKRNYEGAGELLHLDDALLITQTRFQVFGPLFVSTEYSHTFKESDDEGYTSVDNYHFGAGAEFTF